MILKAAASVKKKGAEVFWFSHYSRCAHAKCFKMIQKAQAHLKVVIDMLFEKKERTTAHISAIKAVRLACGSETILSYLEKNGIEALTHLFDTVGIIAVATEKAVGKIVAKL